MDDDELPVRRRKSKKGGKKKKAAKLPMPLVWGAIGLAVTVVVVIVANAVVMPEVKKWQAAANAPKPDPYAWPKPPETPREKLFGTHGNEQVITAVNMQFRNPLRRRSIDPWFRLSNLRIRQPDATHLEKAFLIDVEMLEAPAPGKIPLLRAVVGVRDAHGLRGLMHNPELIQMLLQKKKTTTMEIHYPWSGGMPDRMTDKLHEKIEFYLYTFDSRYSYQFRMVSATGYEGGGTGFKVSNSVVMGSATATLPREWLPEEFEFLTNPSPPADTRIEAKVDKLE